MDARDLFLDQYAGVHSDSPKAATQRTFSGLTDDQMRVRPREDLNSLAWLLWHFTRAEDIMVNAVLNGRDQVFDDRWTKRLNVTRRDFGFGMNKDEVAALSNGIDLGALREYRAAVSDRTRDVVSGYKDADWAGRVAEVEVERAVAQGGLAAPLAQVFAGLPRSGLLSGIALLHPVNHMGEAVTVRTAGGFGPGI
jgi:DinB superfamily